MSVWRSCVPVSQVPYDDLRYLFGEIMYGGHITDDWDRRLCRTYLEEFIRPEMLEGELSLAPGFPLPGNLDYVGYHQVRLCSYGTWVFLQVCPAGPGMCAQGQGRMAYRTELIWSVVLSPKCALFDMRAVGFPASN